MANKKFKYPIKRRYRKLPGSWSSENLDNDNKFYNLKNVLQKNC